MTGETTGQFTEHYESCEETYSVSRSGVIGLIGQCTAGIVWRRGGTGTRRGIPSSIFLAGSLSESATGRFGTELAATRLALESIAGGRECVGRDGREDQVADEANDQTR